MKRNAIIMAAGTSSRFVPLSSETPKGLLDVKGEILVERQIRQLHAAGIEDVTLVAGYMDDKFSYLKDRFGIDIVLNEDYSRYNNTSSLIRVLDRLGDTYICSSDNYFPSNVFLGNPEYSFYSARYANGDTDEYCISVDDNGRIVSVSIGGKDSWYMVGHVYFSREFSEAFKALLANEYEKEETRLGYWEDVYIRHIEDLPPMYMRKYNDGEIEEFDSLDELRCFDSSYIGNTRSSVIKDIAKRLDCKESDLDGFTKISHEGDHLLFSFRKLGTGYLYNGKNNSLTQQ